MRKSTYFFVAVGIAALLPGIPALATDTVAEGSSAAAQASPAPSIHVKQVLNDANGHRIANVYRVTGTGDAQIILGDRMVTIPASTLSVTDGKLMTSMSRHDIAELK
jgi:hypothetical protein